MDQTGCVIQSGACRLTIDDVDFRLISEKGPPLALDLGDIDVLSHGDYQISLKLYTGKNIILNQFGKTFQNLCYDFLEAYRNRLLQCLLLEDLEEIGRFDGFVQFESANNTFSSPAQFRICKSNLAIFPETGSGLHWRLSDFDSIDFDEATYRLELRSGTELLIITKLAKHTREFIECLHSAIDVLSDKSAKIVQSLFPFLSPDQFQLIAGFMREGHSISVSKMAAVHAQIEPVLMEKTVDGKMKPYFDFLRKRMTIGSDFFAGFKMIRQEGKSDAVGNGSDEISDSEEEKSAIEELKEETIATSDSGTEESDNKEEHVLHWFFFPLTTKPGLKIPANVVAWEATSHSGRATYFFRINHESANGDIIDSTKADDIVETAVHRFNSALVMLNFRREPIYLPNDSLATQIRYRHYAIACRKLSVLRELRASYIGRAIHTTQEDWQKQVDAILAQA